jgi:hypothetical protein
MISRDLDEFTRIARSCAADFGPACAKAAFLITPAGFALAEQSASDNRYMDLQVTVHADRALAQHRYLHQALSATLPTVCFPGRTDRPDDLFPNNAFAAAPGRLLLGHMRHPVRQCEIERDDIRAFFRDLLGYREIDLRAQPGVCELTGSLVIDRARGLGYCGLSERCDEFGAAAMHAAFGLRATLMFDLAPGEYHSNVVLSVMAGRAVVLAPDGFADARVAEAIAALYAPHAIVLSATERQAFAGNCLALSDSEVWMSRTGVQALTAGNVDAFARAGFTVQGVPLDEVEKAGGSLRCCVAEIY